MRVGDIPDSMSRKDSDLRIPYERLLRSRFCNGVLNYRLRRGWRRDEVRGRLVAVGDPPDRYAICQVPGLHSEAGVHLRDSSIQKDVGNSDTGKFYAHSSGRFIRAWRCDRLFRKARSR